ncbi:MAG: IclR family transcriptional regulator [Burkholderiaceae bacterium]|nr:IclR family transcriptional regulator [Burkholderiaceae bacterium]
MTSSSNSSARSDTVSALDRGLALLNCFHDDQRALGPTELARLTGIPRPTVIRLAATLVSHRWLRFEPGGERYTLGAGVVSLAQTFLAGLDVRAASRVPMQALAESTGGSVYLAVRDGLEMVLIEACRARSSMLTARLDVGSRIPLPNSALGRAYIATVDEVSRAPLLESLRLARGSDWQALEQGLRRALGEYARTGYCLSAGEFHHEINSVSVALTGPDGEVMAFNCGGPAFVFTEERLRQEIAPALVAMVQAVAADIGGTAPTIAPTTAFLSFPALSGANPS